MASPVKKLKPQERPRAKVKLRVLVVPGDAEIVFPGTLARYQWQGPLRREWSRLLQGGDGLLGLCYGDDIGVLCRVRKKLKGGRLLLEGLQTFEPKGLTLRRLHSLSPRPMKPLLGSEPHQALKKAFQRASLLFLKRSNELSQEVKADIRQARDPLKRASLIAAQLPISTDDALSLIKVKSTADYLRKTLSFLKRDEAYLEWSQEIEDEVYEKRKEEEREKFLRDKLHLIQEELLEPEGPRWQKLEKALKEKDLPKAFREAVHDEFERLKTTEQGSIDYSIAMAYLQFIKDLPFCEQKGQTPSLTKAQRILDREHGGLVEIKQHVLEMISVYRHRKVKRGFHLLLSGPPGTGKTSLGQAIAKALGRPFSVVSLGGMKDEGEIRGHRRTYVGAMSGKILNAVRQMGTRQGVILLDEMDKIAGHDHSEVQAALLELLDMKQNHQFLDHYLGLPFDLSQTIFIATANDASRIAEPLLDRLEVLTFSSYTEAEKLKIAKRYIIPSVRLEFDLEAKAFSLTEPVIKELIRGYTLEGGVRQLTRQINLLARKVVFELEKSGTSSGMNVKRLHELLGPSLFSPERERSEFKPGLAQGLAYTGAGGELLLVEAVSHPARAFEPVLQVTGNMGQVMKESAQTAFNALSHQASELGLNTELFSTYQYHLHFPDGATPKDGPSAGLAIFLALYSLAVKAPLPKDLCLTGEITLHGQILTVGGIKEKLLAAERYGKHRVILPQGNQGDVDKMGAEIKKNLEIYYVDHIHSVLKIINSDTKTPPPKS